jgi:hypothetical protein
MFLAKKIKYRDHGESGRADKSSVLVQLNGLYISLCAFLMINELFNLDQRTIRLVENSEFVDGIGGVIWDGSLVMTKFLSTISWNKAAAGLHLLELGCGAGRIALWMILRLQF